MAGNGSQRPARPRIEVRQSAVPPEEAEAIAAAIERFLRDTAPPPRRAAHSASPWLRAARYEHARLDAGHLNAWGDGEPWGRQRPTQPSEP